MNYCGIDFGTSNSTVAIPTDGAPALIKFDGGHRTVPTALFFDFEERKQRYGRDAINAYVSRVDGRLVRSIKSILGTSLIGDGTQVGNKRITFQSMIKDFLGFLKETAESQTQTELTKVVLGRPVFFVDNDTAADANAQNQLEKAAQTCGFKEIHFQFEPLAAALEYERTISKEELVLVADIGGGTSDFSIIRLSPGNVSKLDRRDDILANDGVHVGGNNLDFRLSLKQVMPYFGYGGQLRYRQNLTVDAPAHYFTDLARWQTISLLYNRKTETDIRAMINQAVDPAIFNRLRSVIEHKQGHEIAGYVEEAKVRLSSSERTEISLEHFEKGLICLISKPQFEEDIATERSQITQAIDRSLQSANISADKIDTVFLTGGSTYIPSIKAACVQHLPASRVIEGDKFGSVGMGLALQSRVIFGGARSLNARPTGNYGVPGPQ